MANTCDRPLLHFHPPHRQHHECAIDAAYGAACFARRMAGRPARSAASPGSASPSSARSWSSRHSAMASAITWHAGKTLPDAMRAFRAPIRLSVHVLRDRVVRRRRRRQLGAGADRTTRADAGRCRRRRLDRRPRSLTHAGWLRRSCRSRRTPPTLLKQISTIVLWSHVIAAGVLGYLLPHPRGGGRRAAARRGNAPRSSSTASSPRRGCR